MNGILTNVPSFHLKPGDVVSVRNKSRNLEVIQNAVGTRNTEAKKWTWVEWNPERMEGTFLEYPQRENIPENINEQLIVELYSK